MCVFPSAFRLQGCHQLPAHPLWIALPRSVRKPKWALQEIRFLRMGDAPFRSEVTTMRLNKVAARLYSVEKSLAECLAYSRWLRPQVLTQVMSLLPSLRSRGRCSRARLLSETGQRLGALTPSARKLLTEVGIGLNEVRAPREGDSGCPSRPYRLSLKASPYKAASSPSVTPSSIRYVEMLRP